jgi:hypothetical protein
MLKATTYSQNCRLRLRYDCIAVRHHPYIKDTPKLAASDFAMPAYVITTAMQQEIGDDGARVPGGPIKASKSTFYRRCVTDRRRGVVTDEVLSEQRIGDISHVTFLAMSEGWDQNETQGYYGLNLHIRFTNGIARARLNKVRSIMLNLICFPD